MEQEDAPSLSLSCYSEPNPSESLDSDYSDGEQHRLQSPEVAPVELEDCRQTLGSDCNHGDQQTLGSDCNHGDQQTLELRVDNKHEEEDETLGLDIKVIEEEEVVKMLEMKKVKEEVKDKEKDDEVEEDEEQEVGDFSETSPATALAQKTRKKRIRKVSYNRLVIDAIRTLGERKGASMHKIYDGAQQASWFNPQKGRAHVRRAIRSLLEDETIVQVTGKGASGTFKLNKKKKKKKIPHKYSQLVITAIQTLGEKRGSSLFKIHNEARRASWFDPEKGRLHLRRAIRSLVKDDALIQVKGSGANGTFKLNKNKTNDYSQLVINAVRTLANPKKGLSLHKVYNEARRVNWFDLQKGRLQLRRAIHTLLENETLIQVKGSGARGTFKLNETKTAKSTSPDRTTTVNPAKKTTKKANARKTQRKKAKDDPTSQPAAKSTTKVQVSTPRKQSTLTRFPPALTQAPHIPPALAQAARFPPALAQAACFPPALTQAPHIPPALAQAACFPPALAQAARFPPALTQAARFPPALAQAARFPPALAQAARFPPALAQAARFPPALAQAARFPPALAQAARFPPALAQAACFPPALAQAAHIPPALAQDARQCISAPCTSMDSERLFNTDTRVVDDKRKRIACDKAELLLFVKKNLPLLLKK